MTPTGTVTDGNSGNNYSVTFVTNTTGVITTRAITVTAVTDTKQYDGTTSSTGTPTITVGSLLGGDSATWTQSFDSAAIGTGKTLTPTGTVTDGNSGNNYSVTFVTNTTGVITTRAITVTAVTDTKPFDGTTTSSGVPTITVGSLLGGDSATWTQTFDTSAVGTGKTLTPSGTVSDGNSGNNYTVTFVANMTGVITATCEIAIEQPELTDLIDGSAIVNFGTKNVAETSSLTFTVRNTGIGPLSLGAIEIDGTHAGDYTITALPAGSVPVAGSTTFVITFSPLQIGSSTAVLHLVNGDFDENPFDITLTGTGTNIVGSVFDGITPMVTMLSGDFVATGLNIETDLGFIPTPGSTYTFIDIVNPINGIIDTFNDLPDGGVIAMNFDGVIYYFQADYTGGSGNDLTLTNFTPAAAPAWRWAAGPNKRNTAANFGTLNVAAATNNPGSRQGAMNWRGSDGSLWMFGGYGYATAVTNPPNGLNDLWQYNRTLGQWIWRSGSTSQNAAGVYGAITVEAAGNTPSARHTGSTWTDGNGNLWLFGGVSGTSRNNDLWRYRPSTGSWTWMKGSSSTGQAGVYGTLGVAAVGNTPGARQGAASWFTPDGNLWLFGGFNGTAYFNDLWSYNLASGMWTWVSGSNTTNANGTYGTQHIASAANVPGARRDATGGWVSTDGSLWMFGGLGLPATGATVGNLNDLWHFNRVTSQWTWIKGSSSINPVGVYGTQGTPDAANAPGGRSGGSGWVTVDGKFWLIGGFTNSNTMQNDVWIYDESTDEWVWMQGANTTNARGVYGTLGVADPANQPGARFTPSTWVTLNGALWIFGGGGVDAFGSSGRLSDLWSYSIPPPSGAPLLPAPEPFPASFTINADPSTNNTSAGTMAYVPVSGQLTGKDTDGDIILFGTTGTTLSHGTLTLQSNGQWTYTPEPGYVGTDTFTFKASDYYGGQSPTRTLTITVVTNPADADNDGIADSYEQSTFGSTGADALGDADGDGQNNYFEYLAGTSPVDAGQSLATAPSIAAGSSSSGGSFKLDLSHVRPGVNYHLETSSNLDVWNRIGTFTFSVAGSATIEDPTAPTGGPAFYRISLEAPTLLP
jgi:VCBS repeat-containing protein